jgi:hypothetical protein
MKTRLLTLLASACTMFAATRAEAIPAFARATGMSCSACHESWPVLNDVGILYRDRGYSVRAAAEAPSNQGLAFFPVSLRTTLADQFTSTTNQVTDTGRQTIGTGGFAGPEADVLLGGELAPHVSAYAVIAGFAVEGSPTVESAWARLNYIGGSSWLNFKIGKHELDLPASERSGYALTMPYLIYHHHAVGSANLFSLGDNQVGVELLGHSETAGLRYAASVLTSNAGAGSFLDSPAFFGHVTYTLDLATEAVPRVRFGGLGVVNYWPTTFATVTAPDMTVMPVPGTGSDLKPSFLVGAEAQVILLSLTNPLRINGAWFFGQEDQALVTDAVQNPQFQGGFLEASYTPIIPLTLFGRLDATFNTQQATPDVPSRLGNELGFTIGARYNVWMSAWGGLGGHVEVSSVRTMGATSDDDTTVTAFLAGLDLAI